jgi:hypothetical protein
MRDKLEIGPTPSGESCEQLGPNYDPAKARRECRAFVNQLTRVFGCPPGNARFCITSNPHDFGTYHEVAVAYDDESKEENDFAYRVEAESPEYWDDEAKSELA